MRVAVRLLRLLLLWFGVYLLLSQLRRIMATAEEPKWRDFKVSDTLVVRIFVDDPGEDNMLIELRASDGTTFRMRHLELRAFTYHANPDWPMRQAKVTPRQFYVRPNSQCGCWGVELTYLQGTIYMAGKPCFKLSEQDCQELFRQGDMLDDEMLEVDPFPDDRALVHHYCERCKPDIPPKY